MTTIWSHLIGNCVLLSSISADHHRHACNGTAVSTTLLPRHIQFDTLCVSLPGSTGISPMSRRDWGKKIIFSSMSKQLIQQLQGGTKNKQTDKRATAVNLFLSIIVFQDVRMARLSSRKRISFLSQQIPSLCTWHRDEGLRFQQSGGSLFLPHVHRRASLFCLNLGRPPSGGWSRWR